MKAMRDFSGAALRQARSGRTEGNLGRCCQPVAADFETGAAVDLGDARWSPKPPCETSAPASASLEQWATLCARETRQRHCKETKEGASSRAGGVRAEHCMVAQARAATRSGRPAAK